MPEALSAIRRRVPTNTAFWVAVVNVLLILFFGFLSRNYAFFSAGSFQNIAFSVSQVLLIAGGAAFVLGAGQLDVSFGANLVLCSVIGGRVLIMVTGADAFGTPTRAPILVGAIASLAAAMAAGACVGLVNALVITRLRVNSFIATLAMLGIATGLAYIIAKGSDLPNIPPGLQTGFGLRKIAGLPIVFFVVLLVMTVLWVVIRWTRFGLRTLAIGSSPSAARRAGIDTSAHLVRLFILVGALCGAAGWLDLSRLATTNISGHQVDALAAISGVVIGGTALFGGVVSIWGAVMGALLTVILQLGLVTIGLGSFYQLIAVGLFLIAAVAIDEARKARKLS